MDNFLNKALDKNNTIIIPGFGALTITSARTRDIYFIPYLKHDDGTLNQIISEITGNDIESSKLYLKEYVATIIKSLEDYSSFEIINFGRFKKIHSGEIEFEKWSDYHKPEKAKKTQDKINVTLSKKENKENITNRKKQSDKNENIEPITLETYQPEINQNSLDEILKEKIVDEHNIEKNSTILIKENIQLENEMNLDEVIQEINATYDNQQKILDESNNETFKNSESKNINEEIISDDNPNVIENTVDNNNNNKEELKQQTKSKRKPKKIKSENDQKNIKNEIKISDKKKKNKILSWLLIGIAISSGTIAFILHSRKNEKIIVNEKIIHKNDKIVKEVKTEIVKVEKEVEKKSKAPENNKPLPKSNNKKTTNKSLNIEKTKIEKEKKSIDIPNKTKIENSNLLANKSEKKPILENKDVKKNNRPTKKELKEADEIVTQLNTNKKNSEAVNTIKTTAISKNKDNSKATENTSDKNLNQSAITTNNSNKNSTTNQTTSIKPPINTNNQNIIKTTNGTSVTTNGTTNNTTTINNTKNTVANSEKTNNKTTSSAQTATQNTTNTKTTNQTNSKTASVQTSNNTKATPTLPSNANPKSSTQQTTALPGGKAGKKIELIAETFKEKGSAEKLANKLKDGGYKNTRIEEKDGQFNVVIDSYNTLSETIKELKKYRSQ
jgi:hypothetical protein